MRSIKLVTLGSLLAMAASCTVPDKFFSDAGGGDDGVDANSGVTLTITISGNSNGTIVSDPAGVDCGADCELTVPAGTTITLTATPDANTGFTGWSGGGCSGTGPCEVTVDADTTIDAAFDLLQFTLDVMKVGNGVGTVASAPTGIDCGTDCTHDYDHGTSVTLTATAGGSDSFIGWTGGGCSGMGTCVVDVTADTTVTASFALNNTIVVTKDGTGMGTVVANMGALNCGADCMESYAPGTVVTLTATAIGDAVFDSWSGGTCSGTASTCLITVNSAVLVTATFIQNQHTLTVTRNGTGTGSIDADVGALTCPGTCSSDYDSGTVVTLTATPTIGKFAGWTGAPCTGQLTPCAVTVTADTSIAATFTQITVTDVNSTTPNGSYSTTSGIAIQVTFSEPVFVTGTPTLTLNSGAPAVTYASGSGTATLVFGYTVAAGQSSADLDYTSTSALALAGGTIKDGVGNDATLTLATPGAIGSLGFNKNIVIDSVAPTVTNVTSSTVNGSYGTGSISIQVVFSEAVTVSGGPPTLALNTGVNATYTSGSGGTTLNFTYTIGSSQNTSDLDYTGTTALSTGGGTIRDALNNSAVLTLATPNTTGSLGSNKALVIDTTAPTVTNVTSTTANGSYGVGATILVQIVFSEAVNVASGTPQLVLNTATIDYASGTGTTTLTFSYVVGAAQNTADLDQNGIGALNLVGATIRDAALNNAVLALPAVGAAGSLGVNKAIAIDTTAPTITNVDTNAADNTYTVGAMLAIFVTFTEPVTVTGFPQLAMSSGGSASFNGGNGTNVISFMYTVGAGQNSVDLDYSSTGALTLNGGTIRDILTANSNNAALALPPFVLGKGTLATNNAIVIDTAAATVLSVSSTTAPGTYTVGSPAISIQVNFSENVTVTGTPTLTLNSGATVNYASGTGTSTLNFTYTIASGNNATDLDAALTTSLGVTGATIRDAVSIDANLTLPIGATAGSLAGNEAIAIDTAAPTVTNVTSTAADGVYGIGSIVNVRVTFNEAVTVVGTPTIRLATGGTGFVVNYASGTGTTNLGFTYTVAGGHGSPDLNYFSTTALAIVAPTTIKDGVGIDANLTLPAVNAATSLASNKALVIRNVAIFVTSGSFTVPAGVTSLKLLVVGGGGGGTNGHQGGGGSGFYDYTNIATSGGSQYSITVGAVGTGALEQTSNTISGNTNGGTSSFGTLAAGILTAAGGTTQTTLNSAAGNGGSGGGGGCNSGTLGGAGGTDGSSGGSCSFAGGTGQGAFAGNLTTFYGRTIAMGAGGAGGTMSHAGGGGGGGITISGTFANGSDGSQATSGKGGRGFGGGGGAGGYNSSTDPLRFAGGNGGNGVVYIEY